jgi:hypothetical protein
MCSQRGLHLGDIDSRPMKLVTAGRRFPGLVSRARNGGKSVRRPGARIWNKQPRWVGRVAAAAPDPPDQSR